MGWRWNLMLPSSHQSLSSDDEVVVFRYSSTRTEVFFRIVFLQWPKKDSCTRITGEDTSTFKSMDGKQENTMIKAESLWSSEYKSESVWERLSAYIAQGLFYLHVRLSGAIDIIEKVSIYDGHNIYSWGGRVLLPRILTIGIFLLWYQELLGSCSPLLLLGPAMVGYANGYSGTVELERGDDGLNHVLSQIGLPD